MGSLIKRKEYALQRLKLPRRLRLGVGKVPQAQAMSALETQYLPSSPTGEAIINLNVGESYNELGVTATDETDGDVAVIISGSVDTSTAGSYEIKYNASDTAGNV